MRQLSPARGSARAAWARAAPGVVLEAAVRTAWEKEPTCAGCGVHSWALLSFVLAFGRLSSLAFFAL